MPDSEDSAAAADSAKNSAREKAASSEPASMVSTLNMVSKASQATMKEARRPATLAKVTNSPPIRLPTVLRARREALGSMSTAPHFWLLLIIPALATPKVAKALPTPLPLENNRLEDHEEPRRHLDTELELQDTETKEAKAATDPSSRVPSRRPSRDRRAGTRPSVVVAVAEVLAASRVAVVADSRAAVDSRVTVDSRAAVDSRVAVDSAAVKAGAMAAVLRAVVPGVASVLEVLKAAVETGVVSVSAAGVARKGSAAAGVARKGSAAAGAAVAAVAALVKASATGEDMPGISKRSNFSYWDANINVNNHLTAFQMKIFSTLITQRQIRPFVTDTLFSSWYISFCPSSKRLTVLSML